jgi:multiple sugar transport system ATP-binding protein
VTHDQVEAMTMGDRIAVMRTGQLRQVGTPGSIYGQPADRFVAAFVGSPPMSFSRFSARREADGLVLHRDEHELPIGQVSAAVPDEVLLGVRPEDAVIWREESGQIGPLAGAVDYVEDLGREWFAGVTIDGGASFVISGTTKPVPAIAERVRFGLRPSGIYLFDPETEACLVFRAGSDSEAAGVGTESRT